MKLKQTIIALAFCFFLQNNQLLSKSSKKCPAYTYAIDKIMNTRIGFHLWMFCARIKHHTSFTFHQIAGDHELQGFETIKHDGIIIQRDQSGKIITIHDGKKTPLALGSILTKNHHLDRLTTTFKSSTSAQKIGIYSLNKCWECQTSGLFDLAQNNPEINHHRYPTTDMHAPSFIDLLRTVHDLKNRDNFEEFLALVHCKAGRGRSATVVAAYLMHILHTANLITNPDEIEAYLQIHRQQVHLGSSQKEALNNFWLELQKSGSFEALYKKNMSKIDQRSKEIKKLFPQESPTTKTTA